MVHISETDKLIRIFLFLDFNNLQIEWFNRYHTMCFEKVGPYLLETGKKKEYEWLVNACAPI